jgi:hypothetical protein
VGAYYPGTVAVQLAADKCAYGVVVSGLYVGVATRSSQAAYVVTVSGPYAIIQDTSAVFADMVPLANGTKILGIVRVGSPAGAIKLRLASVSGTMVTAIGSEVTSTITGTRGAWLEKISEDLVMMFIFSDADAVLRCRVIDCSGTTPVVGAATLLYNNWQYSTSPSTYRVGRIASGMPDGKLLLPRKALDDVNKPYGQVLIMGDSVVVTGLETIGVTQEAKLAGETGLVAVMGGISSVHAGLVPGADYWINPSGFITGDPYTIKVGRALSGTELLLDPDFGNLAPVTINSSPISSLTDENGQTKITVDETGTGAGYVKMTTGGQVRAKIAPNGDVEINGPIKVGRSNAAASANLAGRIQITADGKGMELCVYDDATGVWAWKKIVTVA